jgi:hypothetical protein
VTSSAPRRSDARGIADFDGNGSDDLVWRRGTGALVVWLLDGGAPSATIDLAVDADVVGAGDFDGDGVAELALRDATGSVSRAAAERREPTLGPTDLADAGAFAAAGRSDLDDDGTEELVLANASAIRIAALPGDRAARARARSPWQLGAAAACPSPLPS